MRGEERGDERETGERRGESREYDPGPKFPDSLCSWGVILFAMYVSRVCIRVRGSYQVFQLCAQDSTLNL